MIYAVIDTNAVVSALITRNHKSATTRVLEQVLCGRITPLYNNEILEEYNEVLRRRKFKLSEEVVEAIVDYIQNYGISTSRMASTESMPDEDDRVFYEISLANKEAFLITGNLKHYPQKPRIVSPAEFLAQTDL